MENMTRHRKAVDGLWKIAKKAPQFSCVKVGSTGKEYRQYSRLINANAYKVAVSGACAAVAGELQIDMKHLGMDFTEDSKVRPWSCALAPGAAFMLEQHMAAVVQQILYYNKTIRTGIKQHKRNHKNVTRLSIDEVRQAIFMPAMGVPCETTALPMSIARKAKPGEAQAPGEAEAGEVAAADEDEDAEGEEGADDDEEA